MNRNVCSRFPLLQLRTSALFAISALVLFCVTPALAQPTFSIDGQSPLSLGSGFAGGVSEGDLLGVGVFPPIAAGAGLGILPTGTGPFPGATFAELDAMSFGIDSLGVGTPTGLLDFDFGDGHTMVHRWNFSVDEFAGGDPFAPPVPGINVTAEGSIGALEASADVFLTHTPAPFPVVPGPFPPPPFSFFPNTNIQVFDGDGTTAPPLGLIEPNPPTPFVPPVGIPPSTPDPGDNLDALDVDTPTPAPFPIPAGVPVYFSLDSGFPDPIENPAGFFPGPNYGTAPANGVSGSDILTSATGAGAFAPFAPAAALGLDMLGPDTDDIDALIVTDTGPTPGVYDPVAGPYSWLGGGTDMVLFSVRRGSAIIGAPDGLSGVPIEEGDILIPLGAGVVPGIFVAAEDLGLGTLRSGTATFTDLGGVMWADDLDALDVVQHKRGDTDGDFAVTTLDIDALEAMPGGPIPLASPIEGDLNFDFFVDPGFNGLTGTLVSDVDWLIRDVLGTEYGDLDLDFASKIDAADFGLLAGGFGTGTTYASGDITADDLVDAADIGVMFTNWTGDPGPAGPGTAVAEYDPTTGQIIVSVDGVNNWYVESASSSLTGDGPAGLPNNGGLVTDNDTRIGESGFALFSFTDLDLGSVAALGLLEGDLTINWNAGLGQPLQTVLVSIVPEPTSLALAGLGLCSVLISRRRL